jgi:CHAT domain-containing protein/tetratricopeptide (TPR) repeat protein
MFFFFMEVAMVRRRWSIVAWLPLVGIFAGLVTGKLQAQILQPTPAQLQQIESLNDRARQLWGAGRHAEAVEMAHAYADQLARAVGPTDPRVGTALVNIGMLLVQLQRGGEAEQTLRNAIAILERATGGDIFPLAQANSLVANLLFQQSRLAEAEPFYRKALALLTTRLGAGNLMVVNAQRQLATVLFGLGKPEESEPLLLQSIQALEQIKGAEQPHLVDALTQLSMQLAQQSRLAEAETILERVQRLQVAAFGPDSAQLAPGLAQLGVIRTQQGRYDEAERLLRDAVGRLDAAGVGETFGMASFLNPLSMAYRFLGRMEEAEALIRRELAIYERTVGPDHLSVSQTLNNLGSVLMRRGLDEEAERHFKRSLAIKEKQLGPDNRVMGATLFNLATLYSRHGRFAEAEALIRRDLAINEKINGPDHPDTAWSLDELSDYVLRQGRFDEARSLAERALAIRRKVLPDTSREIANSYYSLLDIDLQQGHWASAVANGREQAERLLTRSRLAAENTSSGASVRNGSEAQWLKDRFLGTIAALWHDGSTSPDGVARYLEEAFVLGQWSQASQASAALVQAAVRHARGGDALAGLVRERQDLAAEWQATDKQLITARSQAASLRDHAKERATQGRMTEIDNRLRAIDGRLITEFPDYAALARPEPLQLADLQRTLRPDEALVLLASTKAGYVLAEETFIWAVTKNNARWVRSELGQKALSERVAGLRCGLDKALWEDDTTAKGCRDLLQREAELDATGNVRTERLPFDATRAHSLYKALFGQLEDLISDKHLLIVPSGALTQLPLQVLVTEPSSGTDHRATAWLARKHAITVLPAVSSLKALRRVAKPSSAARPMLGIGNPLLEGDPASRPWEAEWAKLARDKQACPQTLWQRVAGRVEKHRSVQKIATREGRADLDHLRSQVPLHDTADELCAVAKDLRLSPDDILLGGRATETLLKTLSDNGKLAQYRVLHFATHGTIAGDIEGTSEPGLILTPPKQQSDLDDGYLSASEVAALKLDADWVVLSACNTAAGSAQGAEALSGLARAFIYAGARALLVSHWSVDSAATVKLITSAVGTIAHDAKLGRAEALRRAMLVLIDKGAAHEAHPAYWAPFIVVGEGASAGR